MGHGMPDSGSKSWNIHPGCLSSNTGCLPFSKRVARGRFGVFSLYKLGIASFPGLPYLAFHHLQCRQKAGWELGSKANFKLSCIPLSPVNYITAILNYIPLALHTSISSSPCLHYQPHPQCMHNVNNRNV